MTSLPIAKTHSFFQIFRLTPRRCVGRGDAGQKAWYDHESFGLNFKHERHRIWNLKPRLCQRVRTTADISQITVPASDAPLTDYRVQSVHFRFWCCCLNVAEQRLSFLSTVHWAVYTMSPYTKSWTSTAGTTLHSEVSSPHTCSPRHVSLWVSLPSACYLDS